MLQGPKGLIANEDNGGPWMHMMKRQHKNREEFRKQPEESSFEQSFVVMHFLKVMEDQKLIT